MYFQQSSKICEKRLCVIVFSLLWCWCRIVARNSACTTPKDHMFCLFVCGAKGSKFALLIWHFTRGDSWIPSLRPSTNHSSVRRLTPLTSPSTWTESKRLILTGKKPVALKQRPLISTVLLHRPLLLLALLLLCICKALVPGEAYCNAYGQHEGTDLVLFWELERSSGFGLAAPVKERVFCERLIKFPKPWAACFLSLDLYLAVKSCSVVVHLLGKEVTLNSSICAYE